MVMSFDMQVGYMVTDKAPAVRAFCSRLIVRLYCVPKLYDEARLYLLIKGIVIFVLAVLEVAGTKGGLTALRRRAVASRPQCQQ